MIEKNDSDQRGKWRCIEGKENDSERSVARIKVKANVQGAELAFIEQKDTYKRHLETGSHYL